MAIPFTEAQYEAIIAGFRLLINEDDPDGTKPASETQLQALSEASELEPGLLGYMRNILQQQRREAAARRASFPVLDAEAGAPGGSSNSTRDRIDAFALALIRSGAANGLMQLNHEQFGTRVALYAVSTAAAVEAFSGSVAAPTAPEGENPPSSSVPQNG